MNERGLWLSLLTVFLLAGCAGVPAATASPLPSPTPLPLIFDGQAAFAHVQAQCDLGFRPTGSEAGWATGDYIIAQLAAQGWRVETQEFTYRDTPVRNIIGVLGEGPVLILGAHYDTRRSADHEDPTQPVMGANDGASGVAVLLELARVLDRDRLQHQVWLTFFDAEDNGDLDGWEWCVGSSYMAANLTVEPEAMILVDMVGDADQQIYFEGNSSFPIMQQLWGIAATLGYTQTFMPQYRWTMLDDHVPFVDRGIPAVDLIDFDYPYWHTTQDTVDKVSPLSLERVGRVLEVYVERGDDVAYERALIRSLAAAGDRSVLAQVLDRAVVAIPAGLFTMGSDDGPTDEQPQRSVYLDAFQIDRYEVTNMQYWRFVQSTGRPPPPYWSGADYPPGQGDFPVVGVTWDDAAAYCAWMGRRLPTEAEWEKACRGSDGQVYPWGDEWDPRQANVAWSSAVPGDDGSTLPALPDSTTAPGLQPVGSYPSAASPYGVMDLAGNASEWVSDWYNGAGYAGLPERNPVGLGPEWNRALRGSSWYPYRSAGQAEAQSRCAARNSSHSSELDTRVGFRCARSIDSTLPQVRKQLSAAHSHAEVAPKPAGG